MFLNGEPYFDLTICRFGDYDDDDDDDDDNYDYDYHNCGDNDAISNDDDGGCSDGDGYDDVSSLYQPNVQ